MKRYNIIIDCGHGGIDANGKYTTAPNKMFKFPDGTIVYEGVINRKIGIQLGRKLAEQCQFVHFTVHPYIATDLSLKKRVEFANKFSKEETLFISLHSNASVSHKGRGFEIFTTVGKTKSDYLATCIGEQIIKDFPQLKFRADFSDGDLDKEVNHYVTKNVKMPAVLIEILFFDNRDDHDILITDTFQNAVTDSISEGILKYIETI